eukprot:Awhi_evm1s13947
MNVTATKLDSTSHIIHPSLIRCETIESTSENEESYCKSTSTDNPLLEIHYHHHLLSQKSKTLTLRKTVESERTKENDSREDKTNHENDRQEKIQESDENSELGKEKEITVKKSISPNKIFFEEQTCSGLEEGHADDGKGKGNWKRLSLKYKGSKTLHATPLSSSASTIKKSHSTTRISSSDEKSLPEKVTVRRSSTTTEKSSNQLSERKKEGWEGRGLSIKRRTYNKRLHYKEIESKESKEFNDGNDGYDNYKNCKEFEYCRSLSSTSLTSFVSHSKFYTTSENSNIQASRSTSNLSSVSTPPNVLQRDKVMTFENALEMFLPEEKRDSKIAKKTETKVKRTLSVQNKRQTKKGHSRTTSLDIHKYGLNSLKKPNFLNAFSLPSPSMIEKNPDRRVHVVAEDKTFILMCPGYESVFWLRDQCSSLLGISIKDTPLPTKVNGSKLDPLSTLGKQLEQDDILVVCLWKRKIM